MNPCFVITLCLGLGMIASSGLASSLESWTTYAQRPALMPAMTQDGSQLIQQSNGSFSCDGSWRSVMTVQPGQTYHFSAEYQFDSVALPRRSILAKIDWRDEKGQRTEQPEFPAVLRSATDGWYRLEGDYPAPEHAVSVIVDLIFRWSETGTVRWRNMNLEACDPPAPRNVTLATVNFRPHTSSGPEENRQNYQAYIQEAGEKKADIVCLPEGVTVVGTNKSYIEVAEPVPGPTTAFLGKAAKQYSMYIVAGLYEKVGETVYNTAVLIDRQGNLAGTYRKTALPREEIEGGITPGTEFPVFQTDFGTVGMMICWDVFFPEPARRLAYAGAEVIFLPIWGGNETLIQARAIENQVYVVTSSFDAKNAIWGREGEPLAEANTNGSVALYTVDLNQPTHWPWLGDFQARILREGPGIREE